MSEKKIILEALPSNTYSFIKNCEFRQEGKGNQHIFIYKTLKRQTIKRADQLLKRVTFLCKKKGEEIEKFTVGKTYTTDNYMTATDIDSRKGLRERYKDQYDGYAYMIAIAVTKKQNKPKDVPPQFDNQEFLAIALEGELIRYYAYEKKDKRLDNNTFRPGGTANDDRRPYVIYVAIKTKIKEKNETNNSEDDESTSSSATNSKDDETTSAPDNKVDEATSSSATNDQVKKSTTPKPRKKTNQSSTTSSIQNSKTKKEAKKPPTKGATTTGATTTKGKKK